MARMRYELDERETYAPRAEAYDTGSFRSELSGAMRSAWASPAGRGLARQLASAVPRGEMAQAMAPLRRTIHDRLAPLGPRISSAFRQIWGTSY